MLLRKFTGDVAVIVECLKNISALCFRVGNSY